MAAGYDGSIRIDSRIDTKGFNGGVKSIQSGLNRITGSLGKLAAAVGVAFGVTALVRFGKQAVDLASDLTEVQNVVDTAFGSMSYKVEDFARNAVKNFGMSELAAKQMAGRYMAMSTGMGIAAEKASDLAIGASARVADIASFYNMPLSEVDTMLQSIWTQETESLKRIGVVMTQANLDAYALANGIGKTTSQMTQAEQVQLRYAYVMQQTRLASGDFLKTQDSWANQTRILSEQWKQFLSVLGNGIIQVLTPLLQTLNKIIEKLIEWARIFSAVISTLSGKKTANELSASTSQAADSQIDLADATQKANKALNKQASSIDELNILHQDDENGSSISSNLLPDATSINAKPIVIGESLEISPRVQGIVDKITRFRDLIADFFDSLMNNPAVQWFISTFQDALVLMSERLVVLADWFKTIKPILQSIITRFSRLAEKLWKVIEPIADTAWSVFKDILADIQNVALTLWGIFGRLYDKYLELVEVIWDFLDQLGIIDAWQKHLQDLLTFLGNVFHNVSEWIREKSKAIEEVLGGLMDFIIGVFTGDWDRAWGGLKSMVSGWSDGVKADVNLVKGLFSSISEFIGNLWENLKQTVSKIGCWIWDTINELPGKIGEALGHALEKAKQWGEDMIQWAKESIPKLVDNIVNFFKELPRKIHEGFTSFVDWLNKLPGMLLNLGKNLLKGLWNGIISAKDWLFEKIGDFFGGIGKGLADEMGLGKGAAVSITSVPVPHLATGAVIPPNQQFAAILGDQKHGRNLEAPESLIRQIVREEGGGNSEMIYLLQKLVEITEARDPNVTLEVDGRKLAEAVERGQKARGIPIFG